MKVFVVTIEVEGTTNIVNVYNNIKKAKEEVLKYLWEMHFDLGLISDSEEEFVNKFIDNFEGRFEEIEDIEDFKLFIVEKDLIN
jgi:hypothetical protein